MAGSTRAQRSLRRWRARPTASRRVAPTAPRWRVRRDRGQAGTPPGPRPRPRRWRDRPVGEIPRVPGWLRTAPGPRRPAALLRGAPACVPPRSESTPGHRTRRNTGAGGPGRAGRSASPSNSGGRAQAPRSARARWRRRGTGRSRSRETPAAAQRARAGRPGSARPCVSGVYRGAVTGRQRSVPVGTGVNRRVTRKRRNPGDGLFSRKAALSVSSALESLTSVFGMGTGVASPLESPGFPACGTRFGSGSADARERSGRRKRDLQLRVVRASMTPGCIPIHDADPWSALERSSPRPLVRLGCTRRRASTCRLSSR